MDNEKYMTLNKEVFIIVPEFDTNVKAKITDCVEDLHEHLTILFPEDNEELKVIHGVITKAVSIPGNIKNQKCFIMVLEPGCFVESLELECTIIESDSGGDSDILADEVEDVINNNMNLMFMPDIEDTFIIYGYTMEVGLCVNMDSADEECIDACEKVALEAVNMQKQEAC